ncbi:helix-turn-helix domain-containing protein [Streptomyces sp. NPDC048392]|uniref:helix-turn-helix domain-containing protein n=1 Tax=Streptomyces sp. NPDC048392 TaxID=3365543 RepID=UPI003713177C
MSVVRTVGAKCSRFWGGGTPTAPPLGDHAASCPSAARVLTGHVHRDTGVQQPATVATSPETGHRRRLTRLRSVASGQSEVGAVPVPNNNSQAPAAWCYSGNQIKRWRSMANVSREALAAAANYAPETIASMERGVRMPSPRLLDIADELCGAQGMLSAAKEYVSRERYSARRWTSSSGSARRRVCGRTKSLSFRGCCRRGHTRRHSSTMR